MTGREAARARGKCMSKGSDKAAPGANAVHDALMSGECPSFGYILVSMCSFNVNTCRVPELRRTSILDVLGIITLQHIVSVLRRTNCDAAEDRAEARCNEIE